MTSDLKKTPGIFFIIKWVGASFIVGIFLYIVGRLLFQFGVIDDDYFPVWIIWGGIGLLIIAQSIILRLENIPSEFWFIIGLGILGIGTILTLDDVFGHGCFSPVGLLLTSLCCLSRSLPRFATADCTLPAARCERYCRS